MRVSFAAVFAVLLTRAVCAQSGDTPPIQLIYPPAGTVLSSDQDVTVIAVLSDAFVDASSTKFITLAATKTDGGPSFTIATGNPRSTDGDVQAEGIWDITQVPAGNYILTATMQDTLGRMYQSTVRVSVIHPPVVSVTVIGQHAVPGGVEITFAPTATDPQGESIIETIWNPGDGSPAVKLPGLELFTHKYAGVSNQTITYVLNLKAENTQGAFGEAERDVLVADSSSATAQRSDDCGCSAMRVYTAAGRTTPVYCARGGVPQFQGCTSAGPVGTMGCGGLSTPFTCTVGPLTPILPPAITQTTLYRNNLGWRFEVVADFAAGTNTQANIRGELSACTEGQVVQQNRTRNGAMLGPKTTADAPTSIPGPPGAPGPPVVPPPMVKAGSMLVPNINNNNQWGADDYAAARAGKVHSLPNTVRWTDAPGVSRNGTTPIANSLSSDTIFVTFLTGNLGTCWCQFRLTHSWTFANGTGTRTGPPAATLIDGMNCTLPDVRPAGGGSGGGGNN
jgi:hypothetical protein